MSGNVERRALLALFRNHPATGPGDRYNWKAAAESSRRAQMLLALGSDATGRDAAVHAEPRPRRPPVDQGTAPHAARNRVPLRRRVH